MRIMSYVLLLAAALFVSTSVHSVGEAGGCLLGVDCGKSIRSVTYGWSSLSGFDTQEAGGFCFYKDIFTTEPSTCFGANVGILLSDGFTGGLSIPTCNVLLSDAWNGSFNGWSSGDDVLVVQFNVLDFSDGSTSLVGNTFTIQDPATTCSAEGGDCAVSNHMGSYMWNAGVSSSIPEGMFGLSITAASNDENADNNEVRLRVSCKATY